MHIDRLAAFPPRSATTTPCTSTTITRFLIHPVAREVPVGRRASSEDYSGLIQVRSRFGLQRPEAGMLRQVNGSARVRLKASRRMILGRGDDIAREASESRTTKVKCHVARAALEDLTASTASIGHAIVSRARSVAAHGTIITKISTARQRSLIRANNGSKCKESRRRFPAWEQCNKQRLLRATQRQSLATQAMPIIATRKVENTGNCRALT